MYYIHMHVGKYSYTYNKKIIKKQLAYLVHNLELINITALFIQNATSELPSSKQRNIRELGLRLFTAGMVHCFRRTNGLSGYS